MIINFHKQDLQFKLLIFILSIIVRIIVLLLLPNNHFPDSDTYIQAGKQLFNNNLIEFDNVMPLYPIYTSIFGTVLRI